MNNQKASNKEAMAPPSRPSKKAAGVEEPISFPAPCPTSALKHVNCNYAWSEKLSGGSNSFVRTGNKKQNKINNANDVCC